MNLGLFPSSIPHHRNAVLASRTPRRDDLQALSPPLPPSKIEPLTSSIQATYLRLSKSYPLIHRSSDSWPRIFLGSSGAGHQLTVHRHREVSKKPSTVRPHALSLRALCAPGLCVLRVDPPLFSSSLEPLTSNICPFSINSLESTPPQLLILKNLKSFRINTYKKPRGGWQQLKSLHPACRIDLPSCHLAHLAPEE